MINLIFTILACLFHSGNFLINFGINPKIISKKTAGMEFNKQAGINYNFTKTVILSNVGDLANVFRKLVFSLIISEEL